MTRRSKCCLVLAVLLGTASQQSVASAWYEVALYDCDRHSDSLQIRNFGKYDEEGEQLLDQYQGAANLYRTIGAEDIHGEHWRTTRRCKLSGGEYVIQVSEGIPLRGNGACGAWSTARIEIFHRKRLLLNTLFEEWCASDSGVIFRITVNGATAEVRVDRISQEEYYQ